MKKLLSLIAIVFCFGVKAQLTTILNFNDTNGSQPWGSLIYDGTYLYGMTPQGGVNDSGVIFKLKPDGTGYTKLVDFTKSLGTMPHGSLYYDGTYLYGMTMKGGTNDSGVIFKLKPDGTGFSTLLNFNGVNGSAPHGSLISDGTFLYGVTRTGGTHYQGTIFKIKPDGTGYAKLFDSQLSSGSYPCGSLYYDGTFLYGTASQGGINVYGDIFKIKPDGTGYIKLHSFGYTDGQLPFGSLISDGTYLYGMTYSDGNSYGFGYIFRINPNGTGFSNFVQFNGAIGANPNGDLYYDGTYLYGMTSNGGIHLSGNIFKIKPDGSNYIDLFDFNNYNGDGPMGSLVSDGSYLYGMAQGGAQGNGIVFKLCQYQPNIAIIPSSTIICAGHTATLAATGATSYTWSANVSNAVTDTVVVSPSTNTTYTVTGISAPGCNAVTQTITVNVDSLPTITVSNSIICVGQQTTTLTASGASTYTWMPGDSIKSSIVVTPTITPNYTVSATDVYGCINTITVNISTYPLPTTTISVVPPACPDGSGNGGYVKATATGTSPFTFNWFDFNNYNITTTDSSSTLYGLSNAITDSVKVTDANGCSVIKQYTLTPPQHIVVTLAPFDSVFCIGQCYTITYTISGGTSPYHIDWMGPQDDINWSGTYSTPIGSVIICQNDSNDLYDYQVQDAHGCLGPDYNYHSIIVTVKNCNSGINQLIDNSKQIIVYPNPTQVNFTIETSSTKKQNVSVFDINGKQILSQTINGTTNIDVSNLSTGVYNISIKSSEGVLNKRLVIVR